MADLIVVDDDDYSLTIAHTVQHRFHLNWDHSIARQLRGRLTAGVIYTHYTRESVQMHQAVFEEYGVNRDLLWAAFDFPFNQLKVQRVFGHVPETKEEVVRMNGKMGFKIVATIPGVFRHGVGDVVMCMERADAARWLALTPRHTRKVEVN